jgi:hypothetical protein
MMPEKLTIPETPFPEVGPARGFDLFGVEEMGVEQLPSEKAVRETCAEEEVVFPDAS